MEPGSNLLEYCAGKFPDYNFLCKKFESYKGLESSFDLIYAATSFHWVTRGMRFDKSAQLLKPEGHLVVMTDRHIKNMGGFFEEVEATYQTIAPEMLSTFGGSLEGDFEENTFTLLHQSETDRELIYSADDYIGLLKTFSGHIALGENKLDHLCDTIHAIIEKRHSKITDIT